MDIHPLGISGAYEFVPTPFTDERGVFVAPYQEPAFVAAIGHPFTVAQTNINVSRRGTVRGVHFTRTPPGQSRYVYCPHGALTDIVVDLRVDSPTFGQWEAVQLDSVSFRAVYMAEGLGHAFVARQDFTVLAYLCSSSYDPTLEYTISPRDPALALPLPKDQPPVLSDRDANAPTLAEALTLGILPARVISRST
ncbi:dTDP-4-dehydrorhamnose 3,5-epimerase family protein [Phytoactinopolyspora limicola]|uniref:dTDP-4-dehydrorhamnose 3,5-epimerase family protein n=1 Tax=Phytoactinopolyspora limicola TaxID=2715536 RepID=UPI00140C08FF|nr:dTDP-4-dehydrorhamnose 3,5-epimerase family protein [Phytoactinopolyspora limicola]